MPRLGGGGPSFGSGNTDNFIPVAPTPKASNSEPGVLIAPTLAPQPPVSAQPVPVQITFPLPQATPAPTSLIQSRMQRRLQYVSTANTQMAVTITPVGASVPSYTSSNTPCTTSACSLTLTTTPGPSTLTLTLTDGTNTLASYSSVIIVRPATFNHLTFTANPVVNSVVLSLANPTPNAGTATNDVLTVNALDAAGQTIIGNANYVDRNGNPVALTLGVINNQAGGTGSVTIQGPSRITSPQRAPIYAHYDGNWLQSSAISVAASSSAVTTLTGTTLTTVPTVIRYSINCTAYQMGTAPDGNLWFSERGCQRIGRIAQNGTGFTDFITPANTDVIALTVAPNGNIWFGSTAIDVRTPSGTFIQYSPGYTAGLLCIGNDSSIWITSNYANLLDKFTVNGQMISFNISSSTRDCTTGPDGNMWLTTCRVDRGNCTPSPSRNGA